MLYEVITLKTAGFTVVDGMEVLYVPDENELDKAFAAGQEIAKKVNA